MQNRFGGIKTLGDYVREEQEFKLRKQQAQQNMALSKAKMENIGQPEAGKIPAPLQLANEYRSRVDAGDMEGAADIERFAKTLDKGIAPTEGGTYEPMAGYAGSLADIAGQKKGAQTQAAQDILAVTEPARKEDIAERVAQVGLEYDPQRIAAKEEAKVEAGRRSELTERKAIMPQLEATVAKLSELGKKASYTFAQRGTDVARREVGLDPTEAAVARKEYTSLVDNQILPLLRQTFGAQFTEREGQSLKATLGDVNAHPDEKEAVLRSFIEQKKQSINSQERALGMPLTQWDGEQAAPAQAQPEPQATPQKGTKIDGYWFMGGDPADQNNYRKVGK